jgi:hypothetical protein
VKSPAQLPKADTESSVMLNKEGEYAPNYTPVVATDGAFGTGPNLEGMEQREVEFYTPVESSAPQEGNPGECGKLAVLGGLQDPPLATEPRLATD